MPQSISTYLVTKLRDLRAILLFDLKAIWYPAFVLPVVLWVVVAMAVVWEYLPHAHCQAGVDLYNSFDSAAVYILWAAAAVAVVRLVVQRQGYFLWLVVLLGTLLIREYHFDWANIFAHAAVPVIFTVAWLWYGRMANYFTARTVVTLVGLGFFCYVISQSLDQRFWKDLLPRERDWEKIVEEIMELGGHVSFLLLAAISHARSKRPSPVAASDSPCAEQHQ